EPFARFEPVLRTLGSVVAHVGPAGAGQVVKLCNNLMAGANMAAVAEACAVAVREGIDPALFYELVTASTGDSRVLRTRYPLPGADESHPSNRDFEPMFMLDLIVKDLALACELAEQNGIDPAMAPAALAGLGVARGGVRKTLVAGIVLIVLGSLGFVLGGGLAAHFAGRVAMGLGSGGLWIGVTVAILERSPGREYVQMSRLLAAYSVGG